MALADIVVSITHWISNFLWVCSQPLYWLHCIYETNYDAVSALFSTAFSCMFYIGKAVQLLLFGVLSMLQMMIDLLGYLKYVAGFIQSAAFAFIKFGIRISQTVVSLYQLVMNYGPWMIEHVWYGATWCCTATAYCIHRAFDFAAGLPTSSMLLEPLRAIVSILYNVVVSFGSWLITAFKAVCITLTEVNSLALGLVTGALTIVLDAFLHCVDDFWQIRIAVEDLITTAKAYSSRKVTEIYAEILEASSNAFGSFVELFVTLLTTIGYIGFFTIVCLLLVLIPLKLYSLFAKALRSANTMVSLFHRSLSHGERNNPQNHERQPTRHRHRMEQRLLRERDSSDDESLLRPLRRAPGVPQPRPQSTPRLGQQQVPAMLPPHAPPVAHHPDPSGEQNQRQLNPQGSSSPFTAASNPPVPESTTATAANDLARQLEDERDRQLCVVCQDNAKNILILPCKHLCICLECVEEITGQPRLDARKCPLCRQAIRSYLEVYA